MVEQTSEQLLTALERSKDDPNDLLDQAAEIINVEFGSESQQYKRRTERTLSRPSGTFREEWVLRWLTKRLSSLVERSTKKNGQQVSPTQPIRLVENVKTWHLMRFLLTHIHRDRVIEILVEKNFFTAFGLSISYGLKLSKPDRLHLPNDFVDSTASTATSEPPHKKRKLSIESVPRNFTSQISRVDDLHLLMLQLAERCAELLLMDASLRTGRRRSKVPAFVASVTEAASFVGSLLRLALSRLKKTELDSDSRLSAIAASSWLELWQRTQVLAIGGDARERQTCFNEHCLRPGLVMLDCLERRHDEQKILQDLKASLERQIAMHSILPMWTIFDEKFAAFWRQDRDVITWLEIKPIFEMVTTHTGDGILDDSLTGTAESQIVQILNITTTIAKSNDHQTRRRASAWLEALSICLLYSAPYQILPRLWRDDNGLLVLDEEQRLGAVYTHPERLKTILDAVIENEIQFSVSVARYLVFALVSGSSDQISVTFLSQLMMICRDAFVPVANSPTAGPYLEIICTSVEKVNGLDQSGYRSLVADVIQPLLKACARSRNLSALVYFWYTKLEEAFYARLSYSSTYREVPGIFAWGDEDVFNQMRAVCSSNLSSIVESFDLQITINEVKSLTTLLGSATNVFVKLAIVEQLYIANIPEESMSESLETSLRKLVRAAIEALQKNTDYGGQRWRLWSLLQTCSTLGRFHDYGDIEPLASPKIFSTLSLIPDGSLHTLPSAELMEVFQSFRCLLSCTRSDEATGSVQAPALTTIEEILLKLLETFEKVVRVDDVLWDGHITSLNTLVDLCSGMLTSFCQSTHVLHCITRSSAQAVRQVIRLTCREPGWASKAHDNSIHLVVETLLKQMMERVTTDRAELMLEIFETVSPEPMKYQSLLETDFALSVIPRVCNKFQAAKLADQVVSGTKRDEDLFSVPDTPHSLVFLSKLIDKHAVSVGLPSNFSRLVRISEKRGGGLDLSRFQLTAGSFMDIVNTICRRAFAISDSKHRNAAVDEILDWCEKTSQEEGLIDFASDRHVVLAATILNMSQGVRKHDLPRVEQCLLLQARLTENLLLGICSLKEQLHPDSNTAVRLELIADLLQRMARELTWSKVVSKVKPSALKEAKACLSVGPLDNHAGSKRLGATDCSLLLALLMPEEATSEVLQYLVSSMIRSAESLSTDSAAMQQIAQVASNAVDKLPLRERVKLVENHLKNGSNQMMDLNPKSWLFTSTMIGVIILETQTSDFSAEPALANHYGTLASLAKALDFSTLMPLKVSLDVSWLVLGQHSSVINQDTIDTTMASITTLTSSACKAMFLGRPEEPRPAEIYTGLCEVVATLISRYRRRLTGRFHLLLPAIQNLLKCLFAPPSTLVSVHTNPANFRQRVKFIRSLPVWMTSSHPEQGKDKVSALAPECAERMSRILSSLCNPTASSARSALKRRVDQRKIQLTDETNKVKRIAAEYMQYLIMTFCQSSLEGSITPEMREKLMPGLYTVLDAMDRDVMRGLNEAMDPSSRAIFKSLYDDWTRFGKWDQT